MISWSDVGIVLSAKKYGEKYKIVNVFTKKHGKISAMVSISKNNTFAIFSNVELDYSAKSVDSLGFWRLRSEKQTWVFSMNSENHILVCQSICFLLSKVLPLGVCHERLFEFTRYISDNLQLFSKKDIMLLYAYFEFILLDDIGFGMDIDDIYYIPKVENFYELFNLLNSDVMTENARRSLSITGDAIERNLLNIDNYYRSSIVRLL